MTVHPGVAWIADASASAAFASTGARCTLASTSSFLVHDAELWVLRGRFRTILSLPLFGTVTIVVGLSVEAGRGVSAGVRAAVIPVDLALITGETDGANALVSVHQVPALAAVLTGLRGALVDVHVAIFARVARGAAAVIIIDQVDAQCAVLALTDAVVDVLRAILAGEAFSATAPETNQPVRMKGSDAMVGKKGIGFEPPIINIRPNCVTVREQLPGYFRGAISFSCLARGTSTL